MLIFILNCAFENCTCHSFLKTATRGQVNRPILGRYWAATQPLLDRYWAVTGPLDSRFWASIGPVMAQCTQIIRTLSCIVYWQHVVGQYWPSTGCRCTVLPVQTITDPMLARYRHVDWESVYIQNTNLKSEIR